MTLLILKRVALSKLMCLLPLPSTTKDHKKHLIILFRGRHLGLSKQITENCEFNYGKTWFYILLLMDKCQCGGFSFANSFELEALELASLPPAPSPSVCSERIDFSESRNHTQFCTELQLPFEKCHKATRYGNMPFGFTKLFTLVSSLCGGLSVRMSSALINLFRRDFEVTKGGKWRRRA